MDLNIRLISENGLSPDEYVYLYIVHKKGHSLLPKVKLSDIRPALVAGGWIISINGLDHVTDKFTNLFVGDIDTMFAELISIYPNRVKTKHGNVRVLCAKDPEAASNIKAKKRYSKLVAKKPHLHAYIINCLQNQLKVVDIEYMQNLETWLNNYTWEKYENIDDEGDTERRIVRKL